MTTNNMSNIPHQLEPNSFCNNIQILSDCINEGIQREPNHNTAEQYIYLGKSSGIYFYIHSVKNENFLPSISRGIYDVMKKEHMLLDVHEIIVIYEFYPNGINKALVLQHINNTATHLSCDNLCSFFTTITNAPRDETYLIIYDYDNKRYFSYEIESAPATELEALDDLSIEYAIIC